MAWPRSLVRSRAFASKPLARAWPSGRIVCDRASSGVCDFVFDGASGQGSSFHVTGLHEASDEAVIEKRRARPRLC
jgi:hypothetical protein